MVGLSDAAPVVVPFGRPAPEPTATDAPIPGERIAWLDGPVAADRGRLWLRAWTAGGDDRWVVTLPSPVRDLAMVGDTLWVATDDELIALDRAGDLRQRLPIAAKDLAAGKGVLWALTADELERIGPQGVRRVAPAQGAGLVSPTGDRAFSGITGLATGHFGPGGALRTVGVRGGRVVVLDGKGAPALNLNFVGCARVAVADVDDDGRDELAVAVADLGLAVVDVSVP